MIFWRAGPASPGWHSKARLNHNDMDGPVESGAVDGLVTFSLLPHGTVLTVGRTWECCESC